MCNIDWWQKERWRMIRTHGNSYSWLYSLYGTQWCRGMFCALQSKCHGFESTSRNYVATLDKLLTHNCLWGRQRETTSLISSPGGIKANEPAFRQRTIIIIILTTDEYVMLTHWPSYDLQLRKLTDGICWAENWSACVCCCNQWIPWSIVHDCMSMAFWALVGGSCQDMVLVYCVVLLKSVRPKITKQYQLKGVRLEEHLKKPATNIYQWPYMSRGIHLIWGNDAFPSLFQIFSHPISHYTCLSCLMVWYSSIYIAPLTLRVLLVRLAPRKDTSFKK